MADRACTWLAEAFTAQAHRDWDDVLADHLAALGAGLAAAARAAGDPVDLYLGRLAPGQGNVFRALRLPPADIRVVILGQDPYHQRHSDGRPFADGLCFSANLGAGANAKPAAVPYSLRQIFAAIESSEGAPAAGQSASLANWAAQGALLLNSFLTTVYGTARSHPFWAPFTDALVAKVAAETRGVHFVLWGGDAQRKRRLVERQGERGHTIHTHTHPAAACYGHPFNRCDNFAAVRRGIAGGWDWRTRVPLLEIYTDGSRPGKNQRGAPGKAGGGVVVRNGPGASDELGALEIELDVPGEQTNQRAEVVALLSALEVAGRTVAARVKIVTDSEYAYRQAREEWKHKINGDLIVPLQRAHRAARAQAETHGGTFSLIRMDGHGKAADRSAREREGNDWADAVAKRAAGLKL
jgi:uracil-DNA glycosylase